MKEEIVKRIETIIKNDDLSEEKALYKLYNICCESLSSCQQKEAESISTILKNTLFAIQGNKYVDGLISTGIDELDALFGGGFDAGNLVVIGGRPGMGKTQLLIHFTLHMARAYPVLFCSTESGDFPFSIRLLSTLSGMPVAKILRTDFNEKERKALNNAVDELTVRNIFCLNNLDNVSHLEVQLQKKLETTPFKVVFIDFLQMLNVANAHYGYRRYVELSAITRLLKQMAVHYNVCIIASCQLSRSVETRGGNWRPQLSDIRESGAIEEDADKVIFIHRLEYYGITEDELGNSLHNIVELIVAKNRNGKIGEDIMVEHDECFTNIKSRQHSFTFPENRLHDFEEVPF